MTNVTLRTIQTVAILAGLVSFAPAVLAQVEISPSAMFPAGAEIDEANLVDGESNDSFGNATMGDATVNESTALTDDNRAVEPAAETTESETKETPSAPVTLETIQQQLAELDADKETPDATKTSLKQLLQRTVDSIKGVSEASGLIAKYRTEIEEAPARLDSLKKKLSTPLPSLPAFAADAPADDLVRVLQDLRQQLEDAKRSRDTHAEQWKSDAERQVEWNRKIEETTKKLAEANGEPPVESDDALIQQAHRAERTTRIQLLEKQLELFKLEQRRSDALSSLRPVQQDLDQVTVKQLEEQTQALGKEVGRRRQLETQQQAEEARRQAREADPALQELANGNTELAEARATYSSRLTQLYSELNLLNEKMAAEDQAFSEIKDQAENVGMSETIGVLLRSLRGSLLATTPLKERRQSIAKEMPAIQLQISQYKDERAAMFDLNKLTEEQLSKVGASLLERYEPTEAKRLIVDLLEARKTYLDETIHDLTKYAQKLSELDIKAKSCITATSEHAKYIDEHVLWIRSTEPIQLEDLVAARSGLEQIVTGSRWAEVVRNIGNAIRQNLWQSFGVLLLIALGLGFRDRLLDRIQTISQSKTVTFSYSFLPTLKCLILTAIAASFWPSVVFLV
ncbi:MAG: hypothetical protein KDA87_24120, partial [Planctomycetales bacterium]|nr:hypothetical protein [Planctomycetales bacterium]